MFGNWVLMLKNPLLVLSLSDQVFFKEIWSKLACLRCLKRLAQVRVFQAVAKYDFAPLLDTQQAIIGGFNGFKVQT